MKMLVKILKIIGLITLLAAIAVGSIVAYYSYKDYKIKKAELTFESKVNWQWHDEWDRIQVNYNDEFGRSMLRKVNMHENYVVYARKTDNYELKAYVKFIVDCKPNTSIETSAKYSGGEPIILQCNESGSALTYSAKWEGKNTDLVWRGDIDGFKFSENFGDWDFTKLDQEITLLKAK